MPSTPAAQPADCEETNGRRAQQGFVTQLRSPDGPETCQYSVTSPVPAGASPKAGAHVRRRPVREPLAVG
jgi:hypothetical protein